MHHCVKLFVDGAVNVTTISTSTTAPLPDQGDKFPSSIPSSYNILREEAPLILSRLHLDFTAQFQAVVTCLNVSLPLQFKVGLLTW